ncbi:MAG: hypothetical protein HDQ44_04960, partial [Desulfovibrio sp.]|nr:hypothetical protein [Desulfovibrio sp.]
DVGMAAALKKGTLVAEGPVRTVSDASSEAPVAPRLDMPELAPDVEQQPQNGALAEGLVAISQPAAQKLLPKRREADTFDWGGRESGLLAPAAQQAQPDPRPAIQLPFTPGPDQAKPALALDDALTTEISDQVAAWQRAFQNRDSAIEGMYDTAKFNRLPASAGVPGGKSLNSTLQELRRDFRQAWIMAAARDPVITLNGDIVCSSADMLIASPAWIRQGVQKLWWRKDAGGKFRIVGSQFTAQPLGLEANYLEQLSDDIAATLEDWRRAWEAGDIDGYMSFYAANANQQGRAGAASIRRQKELLWSRVKPAHVQLNGLRVSLDGTGARADINQAYADSAGRSDKGVKTLFLRFDGKNWLIQREDWKSLTPQTRSQL